MFHLVKLTLFEGETSQAPKGVKVSGRAFVQVAPDEKFVEISNLEKVSTGFKLRVINGEHDLRTSNIQNIIHRGNTSVVFQTKTSLYEVKYEQ